MTGRSEAVPIHSAAAAPRSRSPRSCKRGSGVPPSGDRTAPTTGRRPRTRGTARTRSSPSRNAASIGAPSSSTARIAAMRPAAKRSRAPSRGRSGSAEGTNRTTRTRRARSRRDAAARTARWSSAARGPGASLPVGIERLLHAAHQVGVRAARSRIRRGRRRPPRATANPRAACATARAAASTDASSPATCTVPTPSSAHQRAPGTRSSARPTAANASGRDRDPAAVRAVGKRRRVVGAVRPPALGVDVGFDALEQHGASRSRPRASTTGGRGRARCRPRTSARHRQRGRQRNVSLHEHAERAERADEQTRQVVAGDVLDRLPAALHQPPVAGDEPHLEHVITQRAVPQPAHARRGRRRAMPPIVAARIAGIERALLAVRRQARRRAWRTSCPRRRVIVMSSGS